MVYCLWFAQSFETIYDCTEATGRTNICEYKLSTLHHLQDQEGHWESIDSQTSTDYIRSIAAEMIQIFNTHYGQGDAGTVEIENLKLV